MLPSFRFASILFLAAAGAFQIYAGTPPRQALWVYPDQSSSSGVVAPNTITDAGARSLLIQNSSASDVTDLYVSVYQSTANSAGRQMYPDADIADLISRAHAAKIRVWASYGNPDWPTDGCASTGAPLKDMAQVVAYDTANPQAQFDGVALDIEPTDPQTTAQYQQLIAVYQCIQASLPQSAHNRLELAVAIRFSWNQEIPYPVNGPTKKVYEHIIDLDLANVIVLGYRNTAGTDCSGSATNGIVCLDEAMVAYAGAQNQNDLILAGVDTDNCVPGCGPSEVTFFASPNGEADLNRQAAIAASDFKWDAGFGGFAIYQYQNSYLNGVLQGWPAVNQEFPAMPRLSQRR
jgi:hypothetical protein